MREQLVICDNLIKIYKAGDLETVALQGLDLEIYKGEMSAIVGASGSGKSTLMNILGGLDTPSAGKITVAGHDLTHLNPEERTRYRSQIIGHIWQQSGRNLLSDLTVVENIILPQMLNGTGASQSKQYARELLNLVGLSEHANRRPVELSGGQQQRVAIAVALVNRPALLLADEPTGELDSTTTQEIMSLFRYINQQLGMTILIVTHDLAVAQLVDRTIAIRDGRTSTETVRREQPQSQGNFQTQPIMPMPGSGWESSVIGLSEETHQESIYIDRTGLLQLPTEVIERIALRGRAEVHQAPDHLEIWPAGMGDFYSQQPSANAGSAVIGLSMQTHRETVFVDRVGRLQLPSVALQQLPFKGRAYIRIARSHVQLWPSPIPSTVPDANNLYHYR